MFHKTKIKKINHHYKDYMLEASDRCVQKKNYDIAEKYAKDFIECRSKSPEGYAKLGKIYAASGRLKNARAFYEKSIILSGGCVITHSQIKRLDEELKKASEQEELLNKELLDTPVQETVEKKPAETVAEITEEPVLEAMPSLDDMVEQGELDAEAFGEDEFVAPVEEDNKLPSAEELGLDSLAKQDEEGFDFNGVSLIMLMRKKRLRARMRLAEKKSRLLQRQNLPWQSRLLLNLL